MSQKFNKTKEFKELNAKWKEKLKESGFEDIEDEHENIDRGSWDFRRPKVLASYQTKLDYYYMATQFLNEYNFDTNLDKIVWTYHVEAIGVRDIAKILNVLRISNLKKQSIHNIVMRLNKEMKEFYSNRPKNG